MRAFIRPDSSLIWEGPGGQRITDRTGKHQITFSDGTPDTAANGSAFLVPSRVSTLTITNPEPSDTGTYTCRVMGTNQAIVFNLLVTEAINFTNTIPNGLNNVLIIGCTIAAIIVLACLLAVAVAVFCVLGRIGKDRKQNSSSIDSNQVYPMSLPGDGGNHSEKGATALVSNDTLLIEIDEVKANEAYGVATDGIDAVEMNAAYGVATDGIDVLEMNAAYGVARGGIEAMEMNAAYGVARDSIDAMEMNAAYGVDRDGTDAMEGNVAYGVARDDIVTMEMNAAYGIYIAT